jgi:uncharacterized protein (TIGR02453 family)
VSVEKFQGFPAEAFEFYDSLAANNERPWWHAHKSDYERFVRDPLVRLVDELGPEFGEAKVFRPYRDTRFSKDKTPVKDHQGAYVPLEDAIGYYLQLSGSGLMVAGGWYAPAGPQVARFREAVAAGHASQVRGLVRDLEKRGWEIGSNSVKTRPRGVDADAPDLDLLRMRMLTGSRSYPVEPWLGTRRALTTVRARWRQLRPLVEWLADHVGPAHDPGAEPAG